MNTKKIFMALALCVTFLAVACTPSSTAEEDQLYEQGIDKTKIKRPSH